jgi:uncharacterized protein with HEPN domain
MSALIFPSPEQLKALERSLEVVGEYARIAWRDIIGMRNIIAHEYGRVDPDELWTTAIRDAPVLVSELEAIVAALPPPR